MNNNMIEVETIPTPWKIKAESLARVNSSPDKKYYEEIIPQDHQLYKSYSIFGLKVDVYIKDEGNHYHLKMFVNGMIWDNGGCKKEELGAVNMSGIYAFIENIGLFFMTQNLSEKDVELCPA